MTAENVPARVDVAHVAEQASMRPRPMTAENPRIAPATPPQASRFNEAAADDRGKQ